MAMNEWKFAVKSKETFRFGKDYYAILIDGKNEYTGETEEDYIAKGYDVVTNEEFDRLVERSENELIGHWVEISKQFYENQLNVLPPMWYRNGGFFISEAYSGLLHDFYQELNGRFYSSLQRLTTKREDIIADLQKAISEGRIEDRTKDED